MVRTAISAEAFEPGSGPGLLDERGGSWLPPAAAVIGRSLFELALRAASVAWRPASTVGVAKPAPVVRDPEVALPVVLEAWRATERELARMTGDSPDQEYLEANATMLRAMYQRLYSERMRR